MKILTNADTLTILLQESVYIIKEASMHVNLQPKEEKVHKQTSQKGCLYNDIR